VPQNKKISLTASVAVGALAAVLVGVGGYWAQAGAAPGQPVNANTPPASTPIASPGVSGAPTSFADIIERVAPAVVSIDVEGKIGPAHAALEGATPFAGPGDGDDDQDGQGGGAPFDFRQLIPQQPARPQPMQATGSGFFISADGYIVTNNHVVEGADKITVRTNDKRTLKAHLIGRDAATDLAVIKVEDGQYPYVSFEDRAKPRVGDWVVAVGNPFNLGGTATAGIVSALARQNVSDSSYVDYMQIDAPINRGNSGGPTFDLYGRVVGVNTAIFSPSGGSVGIGFDIPADVAASISRQLIADGKVTRGYIGASIQDVTPDIASSLGVDARQGALVADLTPGGPAERAGLKPGDLVLKADGHDITSASDLTRQVGLARGGDTIRLQIRRDGQVREVLIKSGIRPEEASLRTHALDKGGPDASGAAARILGLRVAPGDGGLTIQGIQRNSDAAQKGLQTGDVIVQANGHEAASTAALAAAVAEAKKAGRKDVLLLIARAGQHIFVPIQIDPTTDSDGQG
jgi:serine protease Do